MKPEAPNAGHALLEIRGLRKSFGPRVAVDGISFSVAAGESVALLGPNGAGKTTTLSIVTGLLRADAGEVLVDGRALAGDTDPAKRRLGLVPQEIALYEELPAWANLRFFGALQGLGGRALDDAAARALDFVGLADRARDPIRTFSGGMKRRLNLAVALLHDPELLLLDEPTVGVDPQSRNALFDNLAELRRRGKTLVYTTHYMEEAERLCDRVVIVDHGRVLADEPLAGLRARNTREGIVRFELGPVDGAAWLAALRIRPGVVAARFAGETLELEVAELAAGLADVLQFLRASGIAVRHVESHRASLEDVFLQLTGRSLRDG